MTRVRAQSGSHFNFEFKNKDYANLWLPTIIHAPDTALYQIAAQIKKSDHSNSPKSPIMLGVWRKKWPENSWPVQVQSISKTYSSYFIADSSEACIVAMGINEKNIGDYRYRIIENDQKEIVPWSSIPGLEQKYGAKEPYGYIGRFRAPGKQLLIEIKNIKDYSIRDGILLDWRTNLKPEVKQIAVFARKEDKLRYYNLRHDEFKLGFATRFQERTGIPKDFKFPENKIENIQLFLNEHTGIPYSIAIRSHLLHGGKSYLSEIESALTQDNYIIDKRYFDYPGKYELIINRSYRYGPLQEKDAVHIPFEVVSGPFFPIKWTVEQIILIGATAVLIAGMIFLRFYKRNRERLQRSAQEKQLAALKLKSIRSQLNPHFMFNALTSIQNLINKNDMEKANYYLSKFATITRQVLDNSNEELIDLSEEISLINNYLQMEQLRFNFQYEITTAAQLDQKGIEIPAMILQPLLENAIKHGIAPLKEAGKISISISAIQNDLVFVITDNGRGFISGEKKGGYGLKLSEERIALLNELYKEQPLSLSISSTSEGTIVTIRLSKWLA